jgi:hypothetical protein
MARLIIERRINMLRKDGTYVFYQIQEYQSKWDRWMVFFEPHYLEEYAFGEYTACGRCWQETGIHGIYDLEYAKKYCNDLNKALIENKIENNNDRIRDAKITGFRIIKCEISQKRVPLEYNMY